MTDKTLTASDITRLFGGENYKFARWGRPIAPVVFGVTDETLKGLKSAFATVLGIANRKMVETDPELGSNLILFFVSEWHEVLGIPDLDRLVTGMSDKVADLTASGANQYRAFTFDKDGAIRFCAVFVRMGESQQAASVQTIGTQQMVQSILLWADGAFTAESPVAIIERNDLCIVKPAYAALIRAAYDPNMPVATNEPAHALRLAARTGTLIEAMADET